MVVGHRYDIIDLEKGHLDRKIFVDKDIYQEELEKIFGRAWLMIGHETQIPNPNDFFLTYMGEDPVILTRDGKGELHAFLNMCRHRGNRIVRADDGNAKNFMCAYHGWTFSNEGKLVSVPGLQEAYYGELDVENLGLVSVAHLDTYAGFVFATWAEDAPTLEAYLGDMRWYMDLPFNRRYGGVELIGPFKWIIPNNWKNSQDNFIGDRYHAAISHRSYTLARQAIYGRPPGGGGNAGSWHEPGNQVHAAWGHGGAVNILPEQSDSKGNPNQVPLGGQILGEYVKSILPEMEERLGAFRARRVRPGHQGVFPHMSWLNGHFPVRVWHPRGPLHTEVWAWWVQDAAASDEVKKAYRIGGMQAFGPAGCMEQDDMDNWRNAGDAGLSVQARKYPQEISMGVAHEETHDELPGVIAVRKNVAEVNQRYFYARWQEFMNARAWSDILVAPMTATYEGTAGMKG